MKNIGYRDVQYVTRENKTKEHRFQIGDKITRSLLAVSQECAAGRGVWFGPGPEFKSFICNDPDAFVAHNGDVTKIHLNNGVYELDMREIIKHSKGTLNANEDLDPDPYHLFDGQGPPLEPSGASGAGNLPYEQVSESQSECRPSTEAAPIKIKTSPAKPSREEIEKHNACMHLPFRNWCSICVQGRAKEDPHFKSSVPAEPESELPCFSSDYAFLSSQTQQDKAQQDKTKLTLYVVKEHKTKSIFCIIVPNKGVSETEAAIQFYLECISDLDYTGANIHVKTDQEPSITAVNDMLRQR